MRTELLTPRLRLRPLEPGDAGAITDLVADPEVARSTADLPHPFESSMAEVFLATQAALREEGRQYAFAIEERAAPGTLIGAIGLTVEREHGRAELGYWLGLRFWGRGYATEAGRAMLDLAFDDLGLERVFANHLARNPASGRVLAKLGFHAEGVFRRHVRRFGLFEDLAWWGLVRADRPASPSRAPLP